MTSFEHNARARIFNPAQHPYKHPLSDFLYTHEALPGVSTLEDALNYIFSVLYPRTQASVANVAALPAVGNTVGDFRVVDDDGDGHAAGYQWQQREGDVAAKWYKIYDYDWGTDDILSGFYQKTLDYYVYRKGYDDLDSDGVALTGTSAGQHIYGGASANTHLTLHANAGDGTGAQTGYVQTEDHVRPTANNTLDLGTAANKFRTGYFGTSALAGTLTAASGSITDSSGAISFDNENLSTTGTLASGTHTVGNMVVASGSITNTGGAISFDNENLSTTGTLASGTHTIGTLILAAGSITDTGGSISFGDENLSTTGTLAAGQTTLTRLDVDNVRVDGNTVSIQNVDGNLILVANGAGTVDVQSTLATLDQTVTGTVNLTGQLNADNLRLDGNTLSSTDANGNVALSPNGAGVVTTSAIFRPTTDGTLDLGATANRWNSIYLDNSLGDGTNTISIATLLSFRDALSGAASGMTLFYDGSKWNASAPDTEVDHGTISGLSDDDHTQYALLAGRAGGQSLIGGTAASNNLTFESTSNGTKGKVLTKDTFASNTDASYSGSWSGADLGGSSNRFRHVYTAGEFFGLRLENLGSDPASAASAVGRLWWHTGSQYVGVDDGTNLKRVTMHRFESDTSWDGVDVTKDVTVSSSTAWSPITDARKAHWMLCNNSSDFEIMYVSCKATSASNVRITVNVALPAGSYRLIGIQ
jgi:hypothetical protein